MTELQSPKSEQLQENGQEVENDIPVPDGSKEHHRKTESAKTDKKKKKRNSKMESARADENELHWKQLSEKHVHKNMAEHEQPNQDGGLYTVTVPIVVKPRHIRFEPLENDQDAQQNEVSKKCIHA